MCRWIEFVLLDVWVVADLVPILTLITYVNSLVYVLVRPRRLLGPHAKILQMPPSLFLDLLGSPSLTDTGLGFQSKHSSSLATPTKRRPHMVFVSTTKLIHYLWVWNGNGPANVAIHSFLKVSSRTFFPDSRRCISFKKTLGIPLSKCRSTSDVGCGCGV